MRSQPNYFDIVFVVVVVAGVAGVIPNVVIVNFGTSVWHSKGRRSGGRLLAMT